jgi:hypothetical protein
VHLNRGADNAFRNLILVHLHSSAPLGVLCASAFIQTLINGHLTIAGHSRSR